MNDEPAGELHRERSRYEPARYWSDRLREHSNLRGVGHGGYPEAYNRWIYRQKARVLREVLPPARPGGTALDVGSGIGWVVDQLIQADWLTTGCDISEVAVDLLRQRFAGNEFFTFAFGAGDLPAADAAFDLVTMLDVTYHVVDDSLWQAGVAELSRVLRPGGSLVLLDRFGETDDDVAAHVRFRSLRRWDELTTRLGLQRETLVPAYRWLSRPIGQGPMRVVPTPVRGPLEFGLERLLPREPHMRCARYRRTPVTASS